MVCASVHTHSSIYGIAQYAFRVRFQLVKWWRQTCLQWVQFYFIFKYLIFYSIFVSFQFKTYMYKNIMKHKLNWKCPIAGTIFHLYIEIWFVNCHVVRVKIAVQSWAFSMKIALVPVLTVFFGKRWAKKERITICTLQFFVWTFYFTYMVYYLWYFELLCNCVLHIMYMIL